MKKTLVTLAACVWVAVFAVLSVYEFPAPRAWVLETLARKEGNDAQAQNALLSLIKEPAAALLSINAASLSAPPINAAIAAASTTVDYAPTTLYEFRLLDDVDPCTLNKMGALGWDPVEFGGNIVSTGGFDATCATRGTYDGLDWALFVRTHTPTQ